MTTGPTLTWSTGLRELAEETGLTCAAEHLIPLGSYAPEVSTIAAAPFCGNTMRGRSRARTSWDLMHSSGRARTLWPSR